MTDHILQADQRPGQAPLAQDDPLIASLVADIAKADRDPWRVSKYLRALDAFDAAEGPREDRP